MSNYSNLYHRIKEFVIKNDPAGLIAYGAPKDEYDGYYPKLISSAKSSANLDDLYNSVTETFKGLGDVDLENCKKISEFLWQEVKSE